MLASVAGRLLRSALAVLAAALVVEWLLFLAGDPAVFAVGSAASASDVAQARHELGLDRPWIVRYAIFVAHAVRGDFGMSLRQNVPAGELVLERLPATVELAAAAMLITVAVAVPLGIVGAVRRGGVWDFLGSLVAALSQSTPTFLVAIGLLYGFSGTLHWLPTGGRGSRGLLDELQHVVLPAGTLAMASLGRNLRLLRASLLETMGETYVTTARGKGLAEPIIVLRHALRNACLPVLTLAGVECGVLLSGSIITETVFAWPGIGNLLVHAIGQRDLPVVLACVTLFAVGFILINLLVDLVQAAIDPRVAWSA